jgi:hypothetical protein
MNAKATLTGPLFNSLRRDWRAHCYCSLATEEKTSPRKCCKKFLSFAPVGARLLSSFRDSDLSPCRRRFPKHCIEQHGLHPDDTERICWFDLEAFEVELEDSSICFAVLFEK